MDVARIASCGRQTLIIVEQPLFFNVDEGVREFEAVGNGLRAVPAAVPFRPPCRSGRRAVPARSVARRNGTEAVPYSSLQRFEFPDALT